MKKLISLLVALLLFGGCFANKEELNSGSLDEDGIVISTNVDGVRLKNSEITLNEGEGTKRTAILTENFEYSIKYVANVKPVFLSGRKEAVQANDIFISGDRAYIAYNTKGKELGGALQIVDISTEEPKVILEVKHPYLDINSVYFDKDTNEVVYGGMADIYKGRGAKFGAKPGKTAFITKFNVDLSSKEKIASEINSNFRILESYTVTSINMKDSSYVVSTGAKNGGLYNIDINFSKIDKIMSKDDIRDTAVSSEGLLSFFSDGKDGDISFGNTVINVGDFSSEGHKAAIDIYDSIKNGKIYKDEDLIAFLGMSDKGLKVLKINSDKTAEEIMTIDNPEGVESYTNSVSHDGGLLFTANGGAGFRVYKINGADSIDPTIPEDKRAKFLEFVGGHTLRGDVYDNENYSANEVAYRAKRVNINGKIVDKNYLFVATGLGGVHIYSFISKNQYDEKEVPKSVKDTAKEVFDRNFDDNKNMIGSLQTLKLLKDATVNITFLNEGAGYKNRVGIFRYTDDIEKRDEFILFNNFSKKNSGGILEAGDTKYISLNAGDNFGILVHSNGYNNMNNGYLYSKKELCSNGMDHFVAYVDKESNKIVFGYEDNINLGDKDYDDGIGFITIEPADAVDTSMLPVYTLKAGDTTKNIEDWKVGIKYRVGDIVNYKGKKYECLQTHIAFRNWTPNKTLALWRKAER
ncbi:carbohydrate-binding protein [Haliovirga abyssi]|uniref:Chitin-binding type-3 domain-containing protein n=1 Tax=Haliovirga abyssi TaxID=2996794 RepID=A0AAU9D5A1_9FUSO|nr:carbohydrate-binding protein [Haliovirga abyssi]BDU51251.1 hypothetical protein HLVA_18200 [Haliovirga abyssi]